MCPFWNAGWRRPIQTKTFFCFFNQFAHQVFSGGVMQSDCTTHPSTYTTTSHSHLVLPAPAVKSTQVLLSREKAFLPRLASLELVLSPIARSAEDPRHMHTLLLKKKPPILDAPIKQPTPPQKWGQNLPGEFFCQIFAMQQYGFSVQFQSATKHSTRVAFRRNSHSFTSIFSPSICFVWCFRPRHFPQFRFKASSKVRARSTIRRVCHVSVSRLNVRRVSRQPTDLSPESEYCVSVGVRGQKRKFTLRSKPIVVCWNIFIVGEGCEVVIRTVFFYST